MLKLRRLYEELASAVWSGAGVDPADRSHAETVARARANARAALEASARQAARSAVAYDDLLPSRLDGEE